MTRLLITLVLLAISGGVGLPQELAERPLSNADVVALTEAGLPAPVIVAKIEASDTEFDTSVQTLVELAKAGVHADVVTAMVSAGNPKQPVTAPAAPAPVVNVQERASPSANVRTNFAGTRCEEPGIYLDDGDSLQLLEPTAPGQVQSGGFLKFSVRTRVAIRGLRARIRIENQQPKFLFCFEEAEGGLTYATRGAVNPSDFLLVTMRLDEKQRQRYYVTAKVSRITQTSRSGAASQYLHDLQFDRVQRGVFEAEAAQDLPKGEYAFYFGGGQQGAPVPDLDTAEGGRPSVGAGAAGERLFPFGVD